MTLEAPRIRLDGQGSVFSPDMPIRPDLYPERRIARKGMLEATQVTAAGAAAGIDEFSLVPDGKELAKTRKDVRVAMLDASAALVFRHHLDGLPFHAVSVASEGGKEADKMGIEMPTVIGDHGIGEGFLTIANDVIEGTTAAAHNWPGAISVLAASTYGGLLPTPPGVKYLDKFFGPPQVAGKISIHLPVQENLDRVKEVFGVNPAEIRVVVMDRKTNNGIKAAARSFGATVQLIDAGDLVPSFLALADPNIHDQGIVLVMGRGGYEEGLLAAAAGRAMGGHVEARIWRPSKEDKELPTPDGELLTLDYLVPGRRDQTFVAFSSITGVPQLHLPRTVVREGNAQGASFIIDSRGFHVSEFEREVFVVKS